MSDSKQQSSFKLKKSLMGRRSFLSRIIGVLGGGLAAYLFIPFIRYSTFNYIKLPESITIFGEELNAILNLPNNRTMDFRYGPKAGTILKTPEGEYIAFSKKCTHADCNVTYLPEEKKFFCACHEGYYDHLGNNIQGPPPLPLPRFALDIQKDETGNIVQFYITQGEV